MGGKGTVAFFEIESGCPILYDSLFYEVFSRKAEETFQRVS